MKIAKYFDYFKKAYREINNLNYRIGRRGLSGVYSYRDFLWSYFRYGCLINQYVNGNFWKYRHIDRKKILTYRRIEEFMKKCNSSNHIYKLDNKIEFNRHFLKFIKRDWLYSKEMNFDSFKNLCKKTKQLIIKPLDACEGQGIELISLSQNELDIAELRKTFNSLKSRNVIIEERVFNHPDMDFNNNSVNTIRVNTIMDRSGQVHIFKPVLRAGVGENFVDNYNAGGCEYSIDVTDGIITSLSYQQYRLQGIYHPGCNKVMPGYQIPMWEEVIQTVEEACQMIPECRFIGWDIAITSEGVQLIEGNHNPGNVSIEFFGEIGWYDKLKKYL